VCLCVYRVCVYGQAQSLRGTVELVGTPAMAAFFQASFLWCLIPYGLYIMEGTSAPPPTQTERVCVCVRVYICLRKRVCVCMDCYAHPLTHLAERK
jgi:hypothetical protein